MISAMPEWWPYALVVAAGVAATLAGERSGRRRVVYVAKPIASAAFVALGWNAYAPPNPYGAWIVAGLVLSLVGDVCLALPRGFRPGLVAFLLAHVAYIAGFHTLAAASSWPFLLALPFVAASVLVTRWLWPHLGAMRAPVAAYVAVITVMVWAAASMFRAGAIGWLAPAGALLFYLSDISVARDRFVHRQFANRAWGLPAYYFGQTLLALSLWR
jgi:uncharacterized membrane protein YhhN